MQEFGFYFEHGWYHIISADALDHQLFIAALAAIYTLKDWKQVLVLITAFTIGHAITLTLSVLNLVRLSPTLVEVLIPLTIVVTALSNLFRKNFSPRSIRFNYFLALFFGLVHGLGYANNIRFMLGSDQNLGWSILGFNAGLELGQILVVIFILLLAYLVQDIFNAKRKDWVVFVSGAAFGLAFKLALERIVF